VEPLYRIDGGVHDQLAWKLRFAAR
jgi:hypothetical protein